MAHLRRLACPLAVWVISCASAVSAAPAGAECPSPVAHILRVEHTVEYKAAATSTFAAASANASVCRGDSIRTGERSRATIVFVDNTRLVIDQNTEWVVLEPEQSGRSLIQVIRGAILFFMRQAGDVQTPFVNAAVEGTEFLVRVEADRTWIAVFEGRVVAENRQGSLTLVPDQTAVALKGQAPRLTVRPDNAVQWALQVEPILPADSFARLAEVPESERTAPFYVRRAALLLGVGRVTEAEEDLARAAVLEPANGDVYALRAISLVARNERAAALEQAQEAVKRTPKSRAAHLARAAALQANLRLEQARDELRQVVADQPDDAQAWARLAELQLSLGEIDNARDAAARAVTLTGTVCPGENPDARRARVHALDGFVKLARLDVAAATAAFDCAIEADPGDALAYLGSGLAKIRQGQLAEGRKQIETAVALSPDDAILRSYLGKAYFEEKREPLPGGQYERAKALDPKDPTPWFYDAIRKQTLNRPVEALQDLERSIELNDNRAVYRSRFLLDQDRAARSASLGRLYRDLGFEQLAPVEGWKSLDADPGDYSGHRLLAETYSTLPRHEVARVSELLQSQLLQPINSTPVPPHLAVTDLFAVERTGPTDVGFNEFNPLFDRNDLAVHVSGGAGGRSVLGDEATVSGIWNRLSFSVGQFHHDSEGFRVNNGQDRDIVNAFVQVQLSPATSIQAEVRSDDLRAGDLNLLFNPEDFSPDLSGHEESTVGRIGVRHVFSPRSQLIGSLYVGSEDGTSASSANQIGIIGHVSSSSQTDSWTGEVRHLLRGSWFSLSTGLGRFESRRARDERAEFQLPFPPFQVTVVDQFHDDPHQTNAYAYATADLTRELSVTLGASGDFYKSRLFGRNQFNPKVGLAWQPVPSTTIRVAAFRSLHRALVSSQTIEPTEVAGFNQFFADTEGEESVRYGVALDRKINVRLFSGGEFAWRDLKVPIELATETETTVERFPRRERAGRAYLYWAAARTVSASAEYLFEWFGRTPASSGGENILRLQTHRIPVTVRYFSPDKWFVNAKSTWISQKGEFAGIAFAPTGKDTFWVVDAEAGYRLPRRYGRVALVMKNLFDTTFKFQDTDPGNPLVKPGRLVLLTFTLGVS
jgi:tetratricopeptide (TPR) repeat protein